MKSILNIVLSTTVILMIWAWPKQDINYLNKEDGLGLLVHIGEDCPLNKEKIEHRTEGEFLRAGLKPNDTSPYMLFINVLCLKNNNKGYAISANVNFITHMNNDKIVAILNHDFSSILAGGTSISAEKFYYDSINESASNAITEFLRETYTDVETVKNVDVADLEILNEYQFAVVSRKNKSNAQEMMLDLKSKGYDTHIIQNKDNIYKVIVTVHALDLDEAELIAYELENITGTRPSILN